MNNIVSFAERVLDRFGARPLYSVDSLILSWLSYMQLPEEYEEARGWDGSIKFSELYHAEHFPVLFKETWDPENSLLLLAAMAASPRYRDMRITGFTEITDPAAEKQFAAMTFLLPGGGAYIAYRGTDMSLVGWKEDFNMSFRYPIPAQEEALKYLEEAASHVEGRLYVGGHSKGGNLAVYAAANAGEELRDRIVRVFSHDGPGFPEKVWRSAQYLSLLPKLEKTLPQSSIVGLLLDHQEALRVVKSNVLVNTIWQHNPFTWLVENGDFCDQERLTRKAEFVDHTLDQWLAELTEKDRQKFFGILFSLLETNGTKTLTELRTDWKNNIPSVVKAVQDLDPEIRKFLLGTLKELASLGVRYLPELFRPDVQLKLPELPLKF